MTTPDKQETPTYLGHRERLRQRFIIDKGASMPDYELLELLLTMSIPRRDVKPLAKKLISIFGDIGEVIHAPLHKLQEAGVGFNTLVLIKLVATCSERAALNSVRDSEDPIISNWVQFEEYCREKMAFKEVEEFWAFFFDASFHLKAEKLITTGTINKSNVHPRELIRAAIENQASCVIIAHNHPSGNNKPSTADIHLTKHFGELLGVMDIQLFDHVIVAREGVFSFRASGFMEKLEEKNRREMLDKNEKTLIK